MPTTSLLIVPVIVIALAMIFGYVVPSIRRRRRRHSPIAIVTFGAQRDAHRTIPPRPTADLPAVNPAAQPGAGATSPQAAPHAAYAPPPPPVPESLRQRPEYSAAPTEEMDAVSAHARAVGGAPGPVDRGRVLRMPITGDRRDFARDDTPAHTLKLERSGDGTLQFLPGKLEVVEGRNVGQEIRFVRTGGPDGTTVTFGRSEGPPYRHIQLQEQTVSRQHAKMWLDGKSWSLSNLSVTNPVIVNGLALSDLDSVVTLRDGDRIEMGEVVLRFRAR